MPPHIISDRDRNATGLAILGVQTRIVDKSNSAGVLTLLDSYTLPANGLAVEGDSIDFEYQGQFDTVAGLQVVIKFGGTTVFDSGSITATKRGWLITGRVYRTGAASQKIIVQFVSGDLQDVLVSQTIKDMSVANDLELYGLGTLEGECSTETCIVNCRLNAG